MSRAPGSPAVHLGAGTGLLTESAVVRVPTVYAAEPDARMRKVLAAKVQAAACKKAAETLAGFAPLTAYTSGANTAQ